MERLGGVGFVASLVLTGVAALTPNWVPSVSDWLAPVIAAAAVIAFVVGLFGVRTCMTSAPRTQLLLAAGAGIAAVIVGTIFGIPGVPLTAPVLLAAAIAIVRSRWRLGDAAIVMLLVGLGMGVAYLIEASIHPDTGSYGDQGAILMVAVGALFAAIAVALVKSLPTCIRIALIAAPTVPVVAFVGFSDELGDSSLLVLGGPVALLWIVGWGYVGLDLWRVKPRLQSFHPE
ncbi:MAG: hypothetical protein ACR2LG_00825 [Actinomycetota bacterium]